MSTPLPSPLKFLTSLFISLPNSPPNPTHPSNPLHSASPATKSLLLTLHCLFPTDLLPALDLLDRKLVTRLINNPNSPPPINPNPAASTSRPDPQEPSAQDTATTTTPAAPTTNPPSLENEPITVYYVRSSHTKPSSSRRYHANLDSNNATSYEVRLQAWNCTCAAFTFSTFKSTDISNIALQLVPADEADGHGEVVLEDERGEWMVGGMSRVAERGGLPMCKHLLACLLVERWRALEGCVEERRVGREELAGWGGGWGG
jgi:hypothetical protein